MGIWALGHPITLIVDKHKRFRLKVINVRIIS